MSEPSTEKSSVGTPVIFRRGKKKKATYRQRDNEAEDAPELPQQTLTASGPDSGGGGSSTAAEVQIIKKEDQPSDAEKEDVEDAGASVAELLRLRNARKNKTRGVDLRAESGLKVEEEPATSTDLVMREDAAASAAVIAGLGRRFAAQTGLVGEVVNRHMEEYIESELARRKQAAGKATSSSTAITLHDNDNDNNQAAAADDGLRAETPAQPATRGKLHEVDLGQDMRQRNVVETERAKKRLRGEADEDDVEEATQADKGKSVKRNRRPDEDALRDKMVEEFLQENKMESYQKEETRYSEDGRPHDAKVAEEFRREFMEAIYQRNRRRRPAINQHKRPPKRDESEILKGPKLGGSRNSRAAVREILLKEANEKRASERR